MGRRRKAREVALQVLYEIDFLKIDPQEAVRLFWENFDAPKNVQKFSSRLIEGTVEFQQEIDELISSCSENWSISRMSRVDRNILRLAVYEFLCEKTPQIVVIDEAVDLAKRFGGEESGQFVNGLLDSLRKRLEPGLEETLS